METKPIQLVNLTNTGCAIDTEFLFKILDKIGEKQVAVISIFGEKRTGKSLLLNLFLKFLKNNQKVEERVGDENDSVLSGFDLSDSSGEQNAGIWFWPQTFTVTAEDGSEIELILLDTRGISTKKNQESGVTFTLSLLLSSICIINFRINLNEEQWNFFQYFANFAKSFSNTSEIFQQLVFLVRDWDDEDVYSFGLHSDATPDPNYQKTVLNANTFHSVEVKNTRNSLFARFACISSYLMPHPGKSVKKSNFSGQIEMIDEDFVQSVEDFFKFIIKSLKPKQIGSLKISGISLKSYLNEWKDLISCENLEASKENKLIVKDEHNNTEKSKEIEREMNPELALENAQQLYEKSIKSYIQTNPSEEELLLKHKNVMEECATNLSSLLIDKIDDNTKNEMIHNLRQKLNKMYKIFLLKILEKIENEKCIAVSACHKGNYLQKPDKCVKLVLQCPGSYRGCCESEEKLWYCPPCGQSLEYCFDENFYCWCGRANVFSFKFKCNSKKHSFGFITFNDNQLKELLSSKEINILILGETGVGKSTWINGFVNYITYPSLTEATKHKLLSLIASSFTMTDDNYQRREITCGSDTNEVFITGQSATQSPKAYTFDCDNKLIRLIDTPGICDTRGIDQDKRNFDVILRYLSNLDKLHGICILLKPNNARIGALFRFCIKELLTHLHRDASRNIVFCFTNARSTFYRPGDTFPALETLLRKNREVKIILAKETIYCLDNESFRFLCALHHGIKFDSKERNNYSESWDKSVVETKRMLDYFSGLLPHSICDTLSLNNTRKIIVSLSKPLADISQNILTNINVVEDKKRLIENSKENEKDLRGKLFMEVIQLKPKKLGYPRTVCTDKKCVKYHNIEGSKQYTTEFITHCHKKCGLTGVTPETYPNPDLKGCTAMDGTNNCTTCGCSWDLHMHVTYKQKQVIESAIDESVEKLLQNKQTFRKGIELQIKKMEEFVDELNHEKETITKVSAIFGIFLKENSIVPYNDALGEYLDVLIRLEKDKISAGGDRKTLEGLEQMQREYTEEVNLLEALMKSDIKTKPLSHNDVLDYVNQLYSLKHNGKTLKQLMAFVTASKSKTQTRQEVNYISQYWFSNNNQAIMYM